MNEEQKTDQPKEEKTPEQQVSQDMQQKLEESRKKLFETVTTQVSRDLDRYLLYMLLVISLETFLQSKKDGVIKPNRENVEKVLTDWTETFRKAIQTLIDKDPDEIRQISTTALNIVVNSTREKLFKMLTIPPEKEEKKE